MIIPHKTKFKLNTPWNTNKNLIVNHIELNISKNLLVIATNNGYRVIDSNTYSIVSLVDNYQDLIGDISKALTFFSSRYVFFIGSDNNNSIPRNQLIVWDDYYKKKENMILLKEGMIIQNFFLDKYLLFICVSDKVLIFDNISFSFIKSVSDITSNIRQIISFGVNGGDSLFGKVGCVNMNQINLYVYRRKDEGAFLELKKNIEVNAFDYINSFYFDQNKNDLIVLSKFCNKIHIYMIKDETEYDYTLKHCFYLGNSINDISNLILSEKYFCLIANYSDIQIYKLNKTKKNIKTLNFAKCACGSHNSEKQIVVGKKQSFSSKSFIGGIIRKISGVSQVYQNYIINNQVKTNNEYILFFHKKLKKTLVLITKMGKVLIIKYSKKENVNPQIIKELSWLH